MKKKKKLLIVASFPPKHRIVVGGIEKSSRILVNSEYLSDFTLIKFDSSQISNPPPSLFIRLCLAQIRLIKYICYLLIYKPDKVLIFCSDGPSAIEKGLMIFLARLLSIKSLIFPRAGNLITQTRNNIYFMSLVRFLFNRANFFLCQGPIWHKYAINDLRLDKSKVDIINNWTASKKLIEIGKVHKIESRNSYVACKHEGCNAKTSTSFLICENCDKVTELTGNNLFSYFSKQAEKNNFHYKKHSLEIYGLCEGCKLKN